ncbi:MAG: alcohol dehydrogenase catalytic domain-containing protein [Spirochaetes bacterium]|nr:alcohol dehydrogenase catalytic domain-containing protein [Spirochaetota bacterium]
MDIKTCKSVVIERPRQANFREIELAPRQPDSIIAKTVLSGISAGTDMKTWRGEQHPDKLFYPCVPGYENVGVIVEEGSWAPHLKKGDRVMINEVRKFGNVCSAWGGNMHYAIKDKTSAGGNDGMAKIPDNVTDADAVLAYLAGVALKGVYKAPIKDGDRVLVVGAGMVGLGAIQSVKIMFPKATVCCIERHPMRCEVAKLFADHVILADGNEVQQYNDYTNGKRADVILECSGNPAVPGTLHKFLKDGGWSRDSIGGHIHLQGDYPEKLIFDDYHRWFGKNCTISMTCAIYFECKTTILQWMTEGKFKTKGIPFEVWPVGKCAEAYDYFDKKKGDVFKVLFDWSNV